MNTEIVKNISLIATELSQPERTIINEQLERKSFTIAKTPNSGLLMMKSRDCFDVEFCLGEVLITEAEVELKGTIGFGSVMGEAPDQALLVAKLDALRLLNDPLLIELCTMLQAAWQRICNRRDMEEKFANATKVKFETMD